MTDVKFVDIEKIVLDEIIAWCRERYGHNCLWKAQLNGPGPQNRWYVQSMFASKFGVKDERGRATFTFKDKADAISFGLRWAEKQ